MNFRLEIEKVQHIERLSLTLDLDDNQLTCIVGRNGDRQDDSRKSTPELSPVGYVCEHSPDWNFFAGKCYSVLG